MILIYLILGHLLADFMLQPGKLIVLKNKSSFGIFLHVLIHFTVSAALLSPFIFNGYAWLLYIIGGIAVTHFLLDHCKILYEADKRHHNIVETFLLDQAMHFFVITAAYFFLPKDVLFLPAGLFYQYYQDASIPIYFVLLIIITIVFEIYRFQYKREYDKKAKLRVNVIAMMFRGLNFSLIYGLILVLRAYPPF